MFGLFRRKPAPPPDPYVKVEDANVFRLRVRTPRFKEVVELRFTKSADIARADEGGYFYRKTVVSPQRFERGEVTVRFDERYRVTEVHGEGVQPIPVKEWE
ncbi:hypothetical protein HNR42_001249 [Deinobacterium chartae]|uniref:Uncharacterized protein n=1 Tax=Deinobacterium chartae TaxID=521158 RepID=A0A841HY58_9DEIO|nr:hypothetical protein [Deinobacterium chartae]MBB6097826.1 hypothetical protein [Deinobacterium chartae]